VLLHLDALASADDKTRVEALAETKDAVRLALDEVRRIAYELPPAMLEHLGLVRALKELSATFATRSGLAVTQRFTADLPPLPQRGEIAR
jgi:signal transduction histidine kinase